MPPVVMAKWLSVIFSVLLALLVVLLFLLCFYPSLARAYKKRHFIERCGRRLYRLALDRDLYLINQLRLAVNEDISVSLDHVLFGEKYIYMISDFYCDGGIIAKEDDHSWVYFPRRKGKGPKNGKQYIDNPLLLNRDRIRKALRVTLTDPELIISIVIINDDCVFQAREMKSTRNRLVHLRELRRVITAYEKSDVASIDDETLRYAVSDIHKLNMNKKASE